MSNILITTGIYPPKIGGPAQYAKEMAQAFRDKGHKVTVRTYTVEDSLPTGVRHLCFFLKIIPAILACDCVLALDTFSVGFPSVLAAKLFGKKSIIRTGGDFLWEGYVERTKNKVLLREFYQTKQQGFTLKEKIIFRLTQYTLQKSTKVIFSTDWQRRIFIGPYKLKQENTAIIENYYGLKEEVIHEAEGQPKVFLGSTRPLVWKNLDTLQSVFTSFPEAEAKLVTKNYPYTEFVDVIKSSYAVILISLGYSVTYSL